MNNNRTPFGFAMCVSLLTLFLSVILFEMLPGLTEFLQESGLWQGSPFFLCLLLSFLVGFLIWLNLTLGEMVSSYGRMITELKMRIQALEEKLDSMKKD